MGKAGKKIWNVLTTVLVIFALILALLLYGVQLVGLQVYTIPSDSVEPAYNSGSLLYVKEVDPFELKSGEVITFMPDADTIDTHRIVEVVPDENDPAVVRFRTEGDAENSSLVYYKNVIGTPVIVLPLLGYAADFIRQPPGFYVAIAAAAVLLLMVVLSLLFAGDKKNAEEETYEEEEQLEEPAPKPVKTKKKKGGKYVGRYAKH